MMGWDICRVVIEVVFAMGCVMLSTPTLPFYFPTCTERS
jgi:hypothetical protein